MLILSRYDGKRIKLTTVDGKVFTGTAEVFPSGYGLYEFGCVEESIMIKDVHIFRSDINSIELIDKVSATSAKRFDDLASQLLEGPYWIVDILPEQVPANASGQYFSVERYYLHTDRIRALRRSFAEILLRMNCYFDMAVSFDSCETWELNPDPEIFASRLERLSGNSFLRAVFEAQRVMIDMEHDDTYMTVYDPDSRLLDKLHALAVAEGLFLWCPHENEDEI